MPGSGAAELDAAGVTDPALREAYATCRALNAAHGRTYFLATRLLPIARRPAVHALYGFARYADEIVDDLASTKSDAEKAAAALDAGRAYEKNEELDRAIDSHKEAARRDPQYAPAFLRLGVAYGRKQGGLKDADGSALVIHAGEDDQLHRQRGQPVQPDPDPRWGQPLGQRPEPRPERRVQRRAGGHPGRVEHVDVGAGRHRDDGHQDQRDQDPAHQPPPGRPARRQPEPHLERGRPR